jgi:hypothetical protein
MTYWSKNGKYQTESDKLQEFIPKYGPSDNVFLEQLRIIIRIYYGLNNNGDFSINNGDYHYDYPTNEAFGDIKIPENITEFIESIKDLEYYLNQTGDYENIEYQDKYGSYNYEYNKPYLETISYDRQLTHIENIMNESILFAYENVILNN